jgi:hypothetical protein
MIVVDFSRVQEKSTTIMDVPVRARPPVPGQALVEAKSAGYPQPGRHAYSIP